MNLDFLTERFASLIRNRAITRHFRRFPLLEAIAARGSAKDVPRALSASLMASARCDRDRLLIDLGTSADGLTAGEAEAIRARAGPNEIAHEKPLPWWMHLWRSYRDPFNLLLTVLAVVSGLTGDIQATIVIAAMVALSTLIRFWQEGKSNRAADKLKDMVSNTATVLRRQAPEKPSAPEAPASAADSGKGTAEALMSRNRTPTGLASSPIPFSAATQREELPIKQLVPGDIVVLSAGDMIPADLRVLSAKDLFISQSAMTGESLPTEKFASLRDPGAANLLEMDNLLFMGTNVVSGSALSVVLTIGDQTYFGALARRVAAVDPLPTAFQAGINRVSWLLIRFMLVMAPLVLLINGFTKGDWLEASLFALSVAVGLTPEMLPMIVTSTLAKGAVTMSGRRVIVKRLEAIQSFGAMDVLCVDKTGTLTQDKIFLSRHTDVFGEESDAVLEYAYLNSFYQTGLKNLLDVAVLEHADVHEKVHIATAFRKIDEIPFDFSRRRMSVVVAEHDEHHLLICKGAVEEILHACTKVRHGEVDEALTANLLANVREVTGALNGEGLRVVAVAASELPPTQNVYGVADEAGLTLLGYIAFLDPPKETTAPALKALAEHGVTVKVLTGDNDLVTAKICREVDLEMNGLVVGAEVDAMDDRALAEAAERVNVFARLTPAHKERIVRILKANGRVVGFLGDGINDAAALRAADIGISVDSGVDIAKEAADIILLEKSLMVLEEGVVEGRKTFTNMLKYINMTASSNFGNVFSVLVASAFLPFLPMLPMQLLVQNLFYDISQIAIPFDNVDDAQLRVPQRWQPEKIGRFMLFFGPISSIFDMVTFAMMWFIFDADSVERQTLFQSGWFVVGLLTQTLIVHMIRTKRIPFVQSRASAPLLTMTGAIMAVGIFLPMGPLAGAFKLQPLPPLYFALLPFILLGYMLLVQAMKGFYTRRYGWQ